MARMGLYIHYPYCRRRCDYCDFAIAVSSKVPHEAYREVVLAELNARAGHFEGRELVSIYLGGGTPSLWPAADIAAVIAAACERFGSRHLREVTIEANPIDCTSESLDGWLEAGVNRLSIGVQSVSDEELVVLGRDHSMGDGPPAIKRALEAGFTRVSADVILGTPGSADAGLDSLVAISELGPDHLSVYELTFEDGAPLGRAAMRNEITPRSEEALAELYERADALLAKRDFEHYEISSYARPGARAVHNSLYWQGVEYLGLGASAASYRRFADGRAVRETNIRSAARYLAADPGDWNASREDIDAASAQSERLWLALRTADGVGEDDLAGRPELVSWLLEGGLAERRDGRIRPTLKGFLVADQVAARVVRYPS